jgi:hypothetical protein
MLAERAFGRAASVRKQIGELRVAVLLHEIREPKFRRRETDFGIWLQERNYLKKTAADRFSA